MGGCCSVTDGVPVTHECGSQELEPQHEGQHILLVSHGDTLSILQATFYGTALGQHRQYGLGTAELKQLNSSCQTTGSSSGLVAAGDSVPAAAGTAPAELVVVAAASR